jgi:hypothetical protein
VTLRDRIVEVIDVCPTDEMRSYWQEGTELYSNTWGRSEGDTWHERLADAVIEMMERGTYTEPCAWPKCERTFTNEKPDVACDEMLDHIWDDHMTDEQREAYDKECGAAQKNS